MGRRLVFEPEGAVSQYFTKITEFIILFFYNKVLCTPQKTRFWNNKTIPEGSFILDSKLVMFIDGNKNETARRKWKIIPISHMPRFGGWTDYAVLSPRDKDIRVWFVGWKTDDAFGLSLIPIQNQVRVLVGPNDVQFFGVDFNGEQINLDLDGRGKIGELNEFSSIPLH